MEYIPKEIKEIIENKSTISNIYGMQAYDSIMYGYICYIFNNFMFDNKSLVDFNDFKKKMIM